MDDRKDGPPDHQAEEISLVPTRFSVYTKKEKWMIVGLGSLAGIFSPLTAMSYFPAIQAIADAFRTTVELINVTVTVYMVLQGVSPMLWGTISDRMGRRPLFLLCLALLAVSCVGLALVPTDAYWLLVLLRCFQAAGSASTIALGNGVISDIAEPRERGGFVGIANVGPLVGPCIGPIIGGVLADKLGWRSIFWFLTIASMVYFLVLLVIFPETLRAIVGDGSVPPPRINRPLVPILTKYDSSSTAARPLSKKFINPLRQFTHPSVVCILLFNGTVYSAFYGVTATISTLFARAYPFLSESEIGLCFLAIGVGCICGSFTTGKLLDADFRRFKRKFDKKRAAEAAESEKRDDGLGVARPGPTGARRDLAFEDPEFPIEYVRLRLVPVLLGIDILVTVGYGWSVQRAVHISCPLILQFIIGWTNVSILSISQTILIDLFPAQGSSITAANNLVRCIMGAAMVSVIDFILRALRPGWTYVLLAGLCALAWPANWLVIRLGPKWRAARNNA